MNDDNFNSRLDSIKGNPLAFVDETKKVWLEFHGSLNVKIKLLDYIIKNNIDICDFFATSAKSQGDIFTLVDILKKNITCPADKLQTSDFT